MPVPSVYSSTLIPKKSASLASAGLLSPEPDSLRFGEGLPSATSFESPETGDIYAEPVLGGLHHRYTRRVA